MESGQPRYAHQYHAATKDRDERYGPELSDSGASDLLSDKNFYRDQRVERLKNSRALVAYLLSRLSAASKAALSTLKGPRGFDACKTAIDAFGLWELVLKTHLYGSARTKQRFMIDLFSVKQAGSHESYVGDINTKAKLVIGAFESIDQPGYIKTDDLIKVVYMNGLD